MTDTGPGFTPEALAKAEMLYTDAARSDAAHQGLGLYFARKVAQSHGGVLVLSNLPLRTVPVPSCACRFANSA